MGDQIVWQDRFNIGVDIIDKEHRKLFNILNKLLAFGKEDEKSRWVCQESIKYFRDHALQHFADEETYMESIHYQEYETHRHAHSNFRERTLPALERELERTDYSEDAINHFLGVCAGWLIGHTLTEDHAITGKATSKWVNLRPEEEQDAMRQTIIGLLYDLFRVEARVVSDCYGGEEFGKGIYYRLVYGTKEKERWEIILIFEEKLIAKTIGSMMDTKSKVVSVMLMNATRYTARQFMESIREHFPSDQSFEIKDEQLLTYEQFYKIYERQNPQFSQLFDTGKGYFAFCAIMPHASQSEGGISIMSNNPMLDIERYLRKNELDNKERKNKKRILVVDDSNFILKAMQELLGGDYNIVLANSGLSAIRCITLKKPDLVLLDYEMPVCNGGQVLEMIRSEKDFADIPVFFLTSKVDKESVKKVIALKPEGYLSKALQPAKIKKEIDNYFEKRISS